MFFIDVRCSEATYVHLTFLKGCDKFIVENVRTVQKCSCFLFCCGAEQKKNNKSSIRMVEYLHEMLTVHLTIFFDMTLDPKRGFFAKRHAVP